LRRAGGVEEATSSLCAEASSANLKAAKKQNEFREMQADKTKNCTPLGALPREAKTVEAAHAPHKDNDNFHEIAKHPN
jgi:hypothetical protein